MVTRRVTEIESRLNWKVLWVMLGNSIQKDSRRALLREIE